MLNIYWKHKDVYDEQYIKHVHSDIRFLMRYLLGDFDHKPF